MNKLTLTTNIQSNITILPNDFIDGHMIKADGEYVKIYLLLLRLNNSGAPVTIDQLADKLELTRKDILRALKYWEKEGLLQMEHEEKKKEPLPAAAVSPVPEVPLKRVPDKKAVEMIEITNKVEKTDLKQTVYMAETYIGHPLTPAELSSFFYINDTLAFPSDLMEYLIEYCITRGKKSVRYMESVAISWYQTGIDSVPKAKEQSAIYMKNVFSIMKAFGIANRNPGSAELAYIKQWNSLGFDTDIIIEACNRTMLATHQASFQYANHILETWKDNGVQTTSDIKLLDKKHHALSKTQASKPDGTASTHSTQKPTLKPVNNQFHNFEQRSYDYDDLEARLLDKNRR